MQPLIIKTASFLPYKIPFHQPFVIGRDTLHQRCGFYLNIETSNGLVAVGEIAPLIGRSPENERRVVHDLKEVCSLFSSFEIPADRDALIVFLHNDQRMNTWCASVRFGVESAFFLLAATAVSYTLAEFLGAKYNHVKRAELLQGPYHQVMADTKGLIEEGVEVFKLKVGDRNIPLDVKKVNDIKKLLPARGRLRLDANCQWSLEEACLFCQLVGSEKIEFIEDPLKDMTQMAQFYQQTHMPVALDETLSLALSQHEGVSAFVLKPMIIGGIVKTLDWIKEAQRLKKKAIISSCFESTIGIKVLEGLACLTSEVPGLGTRRWLGE